VVVNPGFCAGVSETWANAKQENVIAWSDERGCPDGGCVIQAMLWETAEFCIHLFVGVSQKGINKQMMGQDPLHVPFDVKDWLVILQSVGQGVKEIHLVLQIKDEIGGTQGDGR